MITTIDRPELLPQIPFDEALESTRFRVGQLDRKDFRASGAYPIIDQGHAAIAGYTDREDLAYNGPLPVVLFGDHTRALKLIGVPFVAGADGTKLLVPNQALFDPLFFYFALCNLQIPARGYNRHYSVLRQQSLPCPALDEQRRIASILASVERSRGAMNGVAESFRILREAASNELFGQGLVQAPRRRLSDLATILSGGTPPKSDAAAWQGPIPWVSPKDMKMPRLSDATDHISEMAATAHSRLAPVGAVLIVVRGMILANDIPICLVEREVAFNQDVKAVIPTGEVSGDYLFYSLQATKGDLRREIGTSAHGTRRIGSDAIEAWEVPVPSLAQQVQIITAMERIDKSLAAASACVQAKDALRESVAQRLFGEL